MKRLGGVTVVEEVFWLFLDAWIVWRMPPMSLGREVRGEGVTTPKPPFPFFFMFPDLYLLFFFFFLSILFIVLFVFVSLNFFSFFLNTTKFHEKTPFGALPPSGSHLRAKAFRAAIFSGLGPPVRSSFYHISHCFWTSFQFGESSYQTNLGSPKRQHDSVRRHCGIRAF